jgi:hypothetical protein
LVKILTSKKYLPRNLQTIYTGNDNIIRQTQKLKDLGSSAKKEIPKGLIDNSENDE